MEPETQVGGTVVGRFRIERVLGRGGMATVFAAFDEQRSVSVALKVLKRELTRDPMVVRRFEREAKAASHLRHANVIEILEWGVQGEEAFIAMELASGLDLLRALSQERPMRQTRAVLILGQVCAALTAAHAKGIVHRDLKPENILLVPEPEELGRERAKVLDFGIAKILDLGKGAASTDEPPSYVTKTALTRVGTIVGTPAYMSPEQCRGGDIDGRSDIYACGVLLYQLVTGELPFSGETPLHTAMRHIHAQPRNPSELRRGLSPAIERTILKALSKWPGERQQTAEQLREELYAALPSLPDRGDLVIPPGFSGKGAATATAALDRSAAVTTGGLGTTPLRRVQLHRVTNPPPSEKAAEDPLKTEPESPSVSNAPATEPKAPTRDDDDDEPRTFLRAPDSPIPGEPASEAAGSLPTSSGDARPTKMPDTELPSTEKESQTRAPQPPSSPSSPATAGSSARPGPGPGHALRAELTAPSPRPSAGPTPAAPSRPSAAPPRAQTARSNDPPAGSSKPPSPLEARRASEAAGPRDRSPPRAASFDPRNEPAPVGGAGAAASRSARGPVKPEPERKPFEAGARAAAESPRQAPRTMASASPRPSAGAAAQPRSGEPELVPTETAETGLTPTALRDVPTDPAKPGDFVVSPQEVDDDEPATFIRDAGPPTGPAVVKTLVMDEPRVHAIELAGAAAEPARRSQPALVAPSGPASSPAPIPPAPPSQHTHAPQGTAGPHNGAYGAPTFSAPTVSPTSATQPAQPMMSPPHGAASAHAALQIAPTLPAPQNQNPGHHAHRVPTSAPHSHAPQPSAFHQSGANPASTGYGALSHTARMSEEEPGVKSTVRLNPQEAMAGAAAHRDGRGSIAPSAGWNEATVARRRPAKSGLVGQIDSLSGSTGMLIGIGLGLAFAAVGLALALILLK
jgi:serine/threonine-protein kinase